MKYCILLLTLCCFQVADAQNVSLVIPTGHGTTITKIQFSGNGKILASSSEDGTVKLWDTEFYREKGVFYNDTGKQAGLFFDSKAEVVFSCNTGGHLVGYNIRKSTVTHSSYLGRVKSVSSVNDSLLLVLSSRDAALKIYNLNQSTFIDIYQGVLCASEYHINSNKVITFLNNGSVVQHSFPFFVNVNNDTVYDFLHPASTILCNSLLPSYYYSSKKRKELAKIALSENGKFAAFVGVKNNDVFFAELESCKKTGRSEASTGGIVNAKDLIFYKSVPICSFEDGTIAEWSCSSPSQKKTLESHYGSVECLAVNYKRQMLASAGADRSIVIWQLPKYKPIARLYGLSAPITVASYVGGERDIQAGNILGEIRTIGVSSFKFPATTRLFDDREISQLNICPDKTHLLISSSSYKTTAINSTTESRLFSGLSKNREFNYSTPTYLLYSLVHGRVDYKKRHPSIFINDSGILYRVHTFLLAKRNDKYYSFYNSSLLKRTKGRLFNPSRHFDLGVKFNHPYSGIELMLNKNNTGTLAIYNSLLNQAVEYIPIRKNDYMYVTKDLYYYGTLGALKSLSFKKEGELFPFVQFDIQYNRPDIVLQILGNPDSLLVNSYYRAWQKRVKKLGIDTTSFEEGFSVPEGDFKNRDALPYEQTSTDGKLQLKVWGMDSTYKLDRFNVWVNEVPVFGQRGKDIRSDSLNTINADVTVTLSAGENKIETSVLNVNGIESYRVPLYVRYTPKESPKEKLYFVGIGINKFAENGHNLNYSVKDIHDLTAKLKEKYKGDIEIDTLFDENVTRENVLALKKHLLQSKVDDKVIIAYSGHGLLSKDYDYYLSTYGVNFSQPQQGGLPYEDLEWLLDSIPARKKLMLIDACHSGELDKEEVVAQNKVVDSMNHQETAMNGKKDKGMTVVNYGNKTIGLKNSFELMQELFANVGRGTGATILSAAAGTQFAIEDNKQQNGYFTYSILEQLKKNGKTKISDLSNYVAKRVEELSNGLQKPTSRKENLDNDWEL